MANGTQPPRLCRRTGVPAGKLPFCSQDDRQASTGGTPVFLKILPREKPTARPPKKAHVASGLRISTINNMVIIAELEKQVWHLPNDQRAALAAHPCIPSQPC